MVNIDAKTCLKTLVERKRKTFWDNEDRKNKLKQIKTVITRLWIGHSRLTYGYLVNREPPPVCQCAMKSSISSISSSAVQFMNPGSGDWISLGHFNDRPWMNWVWLKITYDSRESCVMWRMWNITCDVDSLVRFHVNYLFFYHRIYSSDSAEADRLTIRTWRYADKC